ncbi:hypothetical protein CGC20_23595 [Leishmania donovani]|uniref:Uncharacterized protein n=1 Tax=Leishmania donovani TaxID=5661 RepID=A0A504X599_LEIDO|nr:hypothetical protein CGC20_23595 [Leishmania donovani]
MALCVRRLVLAATLAAVVALLLCTSSAPVARAAGISDFTSAQQLNTRKVVRVFGRAIPELEKQWTGEDFCSWKYVTCYSSAVGVWVDSADYAGTLPEMPTDVDYKHVVITLLEFSAMGQRLSGTLPASWSSMTSLMSLWLEGCERVTGTLPTSWSSMKALRDLNLHATQVSGSLPPQWSSMTSLATLSLRLTKVSGSLPSEWSSMTSLTLLDLQGAKVSGSLPSEWSGMKSAEVLQLQDCDLSGSLPSSWSAMPKLAKVSLTGNHFCGCVPESWTSTQRIAVTIEDEHKGRNCKLGNKCREGYFLTSEKTCRANRDGGVAAASSGAAAAAAVCMAVLLSARLGPRVRTEDSTHRSSCALCCEALVSVPSLPCRRNRAATTAVTLPRRTVPPDADAGVEAYRHRVARRADIGGGGGDMAASPHFIAAAARRAAMASAATVACLSEAVTPCDHALSPCHCCPTWRFWSARSAARTTAASTAARLLAWGGGGSGPSATEATRQRASTHITRHIELIAGLAVRECLRNSAIAPSGGLRPPALPRDFQDVGGRSSLQAVHRAQLFLIRAMARQRPLAAGYLVPAAAGPSQEVQAGVSGTSEPVTPGAVSSSVGPWGD